MTTLGLAEPQNKFHSQHSRIYFVAEAFMEIFFVGDPTVFGNLQPANEVLDAMKEVIDEKNFNGYAPSVGFIEARQAVAEYSAHQAIKGREITAKDVWKAFLNNFKNN